jgi:hypothetical protein
MDTSLYPAGNRPAHLLIVDEVLAINIAHWHVLPGREVAAGRRIRIPLPLIVVVGPGALDGARGRSKGQDPIVGMSLLLRTQRKTVNNQSSSPAFAGHCVPSLMKVECDAGAQILKRVLYQAVLWGASGGMQHRITAPVSPVEGSYDILVAHCQEAARSRRQSHVSQRKRGVHAPIPLAKCEQHKFQLLPNMHHSKSQKDCSSTPIRRH